MTSFIRRFVCLATLGVSASLVAGARAAPQSWTDKITVQKAIEQTEEELKREAQRVAEMNKVVNQAAPPKPTEPEKPPTLPQKEPEKPVSAVVLPPAEQARAKEEAYIATQNLKFAQEALERAKRAPDPTVAMADLRDAMSKGQMARQWRERTESVVRPPPVEVSSVAPQPTSMPEVIVPSRRPLTYGASTALGQAEAISQHLRSYENPRSWSEPENPVQLDPNRKVVTTRSGGKVDTQPIQDALDRLPGAPRGTNFFETFTATNGQQVERVNPEAVKALNDPANREQLEKVGGVSLEVTLDLLSYLGVPEFRRRAPTTVVDSPVLLSLRQLLVAARPYADSPQRWETLPDELRYPGSIERIHGFVLDDKQQDVMLVCSAAREERNRLDIDCLIVGLRAAWLDNVVPIVSLDPLPGRPAGPQYSRVAGVPFDSVFARIMLDADYTMKRITFGELDVGEAGFDQLNKEDVAQGVGNRLSRFWLTPIPLGCGDLHVSPSYRTLLFESGVRCLTESQATAGTWSGRSDPIQEKIAQLFSDIYEQLEQSPRVEPAGVYLRMHALVDVVTAGKILRDMRISYDTLRDFVRLPVRATTGAEATPRSYPGLSVVVAESETATWRLSGGADLEARAGRRSLDMYQDVTTMTLEHAANEFSAKSAFATRIDFRFCIPRAVDEARSGVDLLMMKGMRAADDIDFETARDCFQQVVQSDPLYARAWSQLAVAESMLGEHDRAKAAIAEAARLEPDDLSLILDELAILTAAQEDLAGRLGALAEEQGKVVMQYLSMRLVNAAWSDLERGTAGEKVREELDLAIAANPDNAAAWYVRSLTWGAESGENASSDREIAIDLEFKRMDGGAIDTEFLALLLSVDAAAELDRLRQMVPGSFAGWKEDKERLRDVSKQLSELISVAEAAETLDESSGLLAGLAAQARAVQCNLQIALGEPPDLQSAITAADDAVKSFPNVPDGRLARAMVIGLQGRVLAASPFPDRARLAELQRLLESELDEAVRLDPSYGPAYLLRAGMHAAFGQREKAIADLREAKRWIPKLDERLEQSLQSMIDAAPAAPPSQQPKRPDNAATQETISRLDVVKRALRSYQDDHGAYPASGNESLAKELGASGAGYLEAALFDAQGRILDGWGRPIVYVRTDEGGFRLYSLGPNGQDDQGDGDDIQLPDK